MLIQLADLLAQYDSGFGVFRHITLRFWQLLTALLIVHGRPVHDPPSEPVQDRPGPLRDDGPQSHPVEVGTPTMGGALILVAVAVATFLGGPGQPLCLDRAADHAGVRRHRHGTTTKLVLKDSRGLAARWKYLWQSLFGGAATRRAVPARPCRPKPSCWSLSSGPGVRPGTAVHRADLFHRRFVERGQPDRRSRWSGDPADGARGGRAGRVRLRVRTCADLGLLLIPHLPGRRTRRAGGALVGAGLNSCGSTPTRRRSSWAMSAPWR